jgi:MurNAc alpha-1-phosphate uridylyltransferase
MLPVALLAGGLATRLRPITEKIPKLLVEVAGRPFAEYQLALLRQQGFTDIVLCVGYLGEQVQTALGDGSRYGVKLRYVFDGEQLLGTGGALRQALPLLGDSFMILYGDTYLQCDYQAVARCFLSSKKSGLMTVLHNQNRWDKSNAVFMNDSVVQYNKRQYKPEMEYVDYGLGALQASVLAAYPENQPIDLADVYTKLATQQQLAGFEVQQRFYEIGSPQGLAETEQYLSTINQGRS